ncbi:protein tyrosine phosphatase family protein [Sulfurospirillum arcachonense]|uniref:protein tyrosine phosphatase family protein n=1 Tax=Sulfurospirillum arcachonense TaxID=57666 RepID=UPI00046A85E6|nr:protein tyrosine phosphatase family protein [Sulfurospirillum arcachonense]
MESILNYIKFNENISTAGQPNSKEFKKIAKKGFDVVINLALSESTNALKNEGKVVTKNKMSYIHIPISWKKPEKEKLQLFLKILKVLQKENKKVFIHCAKNYRVSVFMYHYKKQIVKEKEPKLLAPKDFRINKTWKKFLLS